MRVKLAMEEHKVLENIKIKKFIIKGNGNKIKEMEKEYKQIS